MARSYTENRSTKTRNGPRREGNFNSEDSAATRKSELSLDISPDLLRCVRLSKTLRGFGTMWSTSPLDLSSDGKMKLWDMSKKTERIDIFVSQTWQSRGWKKYLSLVVMFHLKVAAGLAFATMIILIVLTVYGVLPRDHVAQLPNRTVRHPQWAYVPSVVGFLALLLVSEFRLLCGDPRIFFDAVCINQADDELKHEGIYSLGAFISKSDTLLVLWDEQYFRRGWCVFELATFVALHDVSRIRFEPLFISIWQLSAFLAITTIFVMQGVLSYAGLGLQMRLSLGFIVDVPFFYVCVRVGRSFMDARHNLIAQMEAFMIEASECRDEGDRVLIVGHIERLFGSKTEFDHFVRGPLKDLVVSKMTGPCLLSYWSFLVMSSPALGSVAQWTAAHIENNSPADVTLNAIALTLSWALFSMPAILKMLLLACDCIRKQRSCNVMLDLLISVLFSVLLTGHILVGNFLVGKQLYAGCWTLALSGALAMYLFRRDVVRWWGALIGADDWAQKQDISRNMPPSSARAQKQDISRNMPPSCAREPGVVLYEL